MPVNKSFSLLAVPGVQKLQPYQAGKPVETLERELGITGSIKLASNENPLGASPLAQKAIQEHLASINYYPDSGGYKLTARLAKQFAINAECITLGNGSNDVLELVARAFLSAGRAAVYSEYAFAVYPIVVQAIGAEARVASAYPENHHSMPLGHNPQALIDCVDDNTRVMFIANPNNPTGTWLNISAIINLLDVVPTEVVVVLDMAYVEYMSKALQPDFSSLLNKYANLVITGTFSKIHALAGLRIGYALSSPEIADLLNRVRQPFNTNLLAQEAALASLDDVEHVGKSIVLNNEGKSFLQTAFDDMGLMHLPSMGNFISFKLQQPALSIYEQLLQQGVIVRPLANYAMAEYLRVTIGDAAQNKRFITALVNVLESSINNTSTGNS